MTEALLGETPTDDVASAMLAQEIRNYVRGLDDFKLM
jgi:hypothetical protein